MPPPPTDTQLAIGARDDPEQFAELYRRTVDTIVGYLARRCANPEDVADITATTYVIALESLGSFDPERGRPVPWLLGIAGRVLANQQRRTGRASAASARLRGRRLLDAADFERLEDRIDAERLAPHLATAIEGLSPAHREAVLLTSADGLSPADAARALGIHPAAFRVRLHRARKALQQRLGAEGAPTAPLRTHNGDLFA